MLGLSGIYSVFTNLDRKVLYYCRLLVFTGIFLWLFQSLLWFCVFIGFYCPWQWSEYVTLTVDLLCPLPRRRGIKQWCSLTSVCLLRTSGLSREPRGLGRLKLAQRNYVTRDLDTTFKVKVTGAGHIVAASHLQLVYWCMHALDNSRVIDGFGANFQDEHIINVQQNV